MSSTPTVTVVLPTHDRAALLKRALAAILAQTFTSFDVVVVDDDSSEDVAGAVASLGDARVRVIRTPGRLRAAAGRNFGVAQTTATWVAFADSDDVWLPDKLALQMAAAARAPADVAVVYTGFHRRKGKQTQEFPRPDDAPLEGDLHRTLLERNFITTGAALVRRSAFTAAQGFDPRMPRYQDWELWVRLARQHRFVHVPGAHVLQEDQPDSISRDDAARVAGRLMFLAKFRKDMLRYPGLRARQLHKIGLMVRRSHPWKARRLLLAAFARNPRDVQALRDLFR